MPATRKVMLGIPSYDNKVTVNTFFSCMRDVSASAGKIEYIFKINSGCCLIARARNLITTAFLNSDCTDLFFIDADLGWEPGALQRMIEHPVDMVAGIYPKRTDRYTDFPVIWPQDCGGEVTMDAVTRLVPADGVPTGFLRMRRNVIERMVEAFEHTKHVDQDSELPGKVSYAIFDHEISDNTYWGEDYTFCRRWKRLGGEIFVDPEITFEHVGEKTYAGQLWKWMIDGWPGHPAHDLIQKQIAEREAKKLQASEPELPLETQLEAV